MSSRDFQKKNSKNSNIIPKKDKIPKEIKKFPQKNGFMGWKRKLY